MGRQEYINKIIEYLSLLKSKVELSNSLNLTDVNIHLENFYRDLFNLLYGYNLKNINITKSNTAAIDLGDEELKLAFQITSTSGLGKIKKTMASFIDAKLYQKYDRLVIVQIVKKLKSKASYVGEEKIFQLDTKKDIWDSSNILKDINDLDLDRIKSVYEYLKIQLKTIADPVGIKEISKEVSTFMSLIEFLSDESHPLAGSGFIEEPDPDGKIYTRFTSHSEFLTNEFTSLYEEYGPVFNAFMEQSDYGQTRIRRLGLHLKTFSDKVLSEKNNNAKEALDALAKHFEELLSEQGIEFDGPAVRFFLVDQLIKCNIFPNKNEKDS